MGYLSERASYVKGLMDGMKYDTSTSEGKLIKAILDLVDDVCVAVEELEEDSDSIMEDIETLDDRLSDVEDDLYSYDDDEDDDEDEYDYEEDVSEPLTCPECGAELDFDELDIDENTTSFCCPECNTKIDIEWLDSDLDDEE